MENNISNKMWGINLENEKYFWHKNILNKFITPPEKCSICNNGLLNIINNNSLNNYLRDGTIFAINNPTPVSVLYTILKL